MLEAVLLKTPQMHSITHMKLAAGWAFIEVNFEPTQQMLCSFIFTANVFPNH